MDADSEAAFRKHRTAWKFFEAQPPSYRRRMAYLITSAKRPETRARRLKLLIEFSEKGERRP
ncbi:MAG TPA: YdeI/OmpD-associated family protein [Candidatus Dormibacteraeota bacterium]|nr:YdeI/OmpD-associated family protein [Candidatus Dormibacteraeota bacterium]